MLVTILISLQQFCDRIRRVIVQIENFRREITQFFNLPNNIPVPQQIPQPAVHPPLRRSKRNRRQPHRLRY